VNRGFVNTDPNDIIMHSDVDELARPEFVRLLKYYDIELPFRICHYSYYYNFHWEFDNLRPGVKVFTIQKYLREEKLMRHLPGPGWHCSSCLTIPDMITKLETFSHTEFNTPAIKDEANLKDAIATGRDFASRNIPRPRATQYPGDIPEYIIKNLNRFGYLVPVEKYPNIVEDHEKNYCARVESKFCSAD